MLRVGIMTQKILPSYSGFFLKCFWYLQQDILSFTLSIMLINSLLNRTCQTQTHWHEAGFLEPTVAACVTADSRTLHYIRLLSKPTLMKLVTALVTDAGWSASDTNLSFVPCSRSPSKRKTDGMKECAENGRGAGDFLVVYMLLLHSQASMLISPLSCC